MASPIVIALDAMGGDGGPAVAVGGAAIALVRHPELRFRFHGDEKQIAPLLDAEPALLAASTIIHTDMAIGSHDKPSHALMRGRYHSSMWQAIESVKKGEAQLAVSGGNTGALMAMAKVCLKMIPGIDRPVIAAVWPTVDAECLVLDLGANVGFSAAQLVDTALMGAVTAQALFNLPRPSVGLLNIGVEEVKGLEDIRRAHAALKAAPTLPFEYRGFVEADRIGHGAADVVVTDGFTGNIALKAAEGTARQIAEYLRQAMRRSLLSRIGGFLAQGAFRVLKDKMDPRKFNGGVFLGLNGLVIKSHGGTDALGYASAIDIGAEIARAGLVDRIRRDLTAAIAEVKGTLAAADGEAATAKLTRRAENTTVGS
jgi:phosphate acyltransferase